MSLINKKFNNKEKLIIVNSIFAIVLLSLALIVILPGVKKVDQIDFDTLAQLDALTLLAQKGQEVSKLNQSLSSIEPLLLSLSSRFIGDEVEFVTRMEDLGAKYGLTQRMQMGDAQVINQYKRMPMVMYTQGAMNDQLRFIDAIEHFGYFFNIKSVEMTPITSEPGQPQLTNMTLQIDTYWINK